MNKFKKSDWPFYTFVALILAVVLAYFTVPYWTHTTQTVNIVAVETKMDKYLIFTENSVFENTDTWYYLKFNSSDIQGQAMPKGKFTISYYGFRIPFFSKYPNIISVTKR